MYEAMSSALRAVTAGPVGQAEVLVALLVVAVPTFLVCATVIILVVAVERKNRVQAIRALAPLVTALVRPLWRRVPRARSDQGKGRPPGDHPARNRRFEPSRSCRRL